MRLADLMLEHFDDPDGGGFFFTADDHETLISRNKDIYDNATPSGNAMAATALLRLGKLTGRADYLEAAAGVLRLGAPVVERFVLAGAQLAMALDLYLGPTSEIVMLGGKDEAETSRALRSLRTRFVPHCVVACRPGTTSSPGSPHLEPLFAGKVPAADAPTVYVCENFTCQAPVSGAEAIEQTWDRLSATTDRDP